MRARPRRSHIVANQRSKESRPSVVDERRPRRPGARDRTARESTRPRGPCAVGGRQRSSARPDERLQHARFQMGLGKRLEPSARGRQVRRARRRDRSAPTSCPAARQDTRQLRSARALTQPPRAPQNRARRRERAIGPVIARPCRPATNSAAGRRVPTSTGGARDHAQRHARIPARVSPRRARPPTRRLLGVGAGSKAASNRGSSRCGRHTSSTSPAMTYDVSYARPRGQGIYQRETRPFGARVARECPTTKRAVAPATRRSSLQRRAVPTRHLERARDGAGTRARRTIDVRALPLLPPRRPAS